MSPAIGKDELGDMLSLSRAIGQDLKGHAGETTDQGSPEQPED